MARKYRWMRHPRTTQERRANQLRNDQFVRAGRRNLPTTYDDVQIGSQKSWKSRRDKQYREAGSGYLWWEFNYHWTDRVSRMIARNIQKNLDDIGCYHEHTVDGIRWFGPPDVW